VPNPENPKPLLQAGFTDGDRNFLTRREAAERPTHAQVPGTMEVSFNEAILTDAERSWMTEAYGLEIARERLGEPASASFFRRRGPVLSRLEGSTLHVTLGKTFGGHRPAVTP
jgi:hypothetical protein